MSYSHIPCTCRSVTLQRFFAVLWTSRYGEPAGNSFFGLIRCGRKGFMIVWRREIGVDLSDRVEISIVSVCCGIVAMVQLWCLTSLRIRSRLFSGKVLFAQGYDYEVRRKGCSIETE